MRGEILSISVVSRPSGDPYLTISRISTILSKMVKTPGPGILTYMGPPGPGILTYMGPPGPGILTYMGPPNPSPSLGPIPGPGILTYMSPLGLGSSLIWAP